jgi:CHAT domain-containing protein/Tfp pilus assembly protein PilF
MINRGRARKFIIIALFQVLIILNPYAQKINNLKCDSVIYLNNKGADYSAAGEWELARLTLMKALEYAQLCYDTDSMQRIPSIINLGITYAQTWQYDKALILFHRAEKIYETSLKKNSEYLIFIYLSIGKIYSLIGDYSNAEEYYSNALILFREIKAFSEINKKSTIILYNSLGVLYKKKRNYNTAITQYHKAIQISSEIDIEMLSILFNNIANVYREMKNFKLSEKYFELAIKENKKLNKNDSINLAITLTDYSSLLLKEKKLTQAKPVIDQALSISYKILGTRNPQVSEIQVNMGNYFELSGQYDKALFWYQQSARSLIKSNNIFTPGIGGLPDDIISKQHFLVSLKALANIYQLKYDKSNSLKLLIKSLMIYEQAIKCADLIRHGYLNDDSRLFLAENEKSTLNNALFVALKLYDITGDEKYQYKAFEFSEKSKATILLSAIQSNTAINFGGIPEALGNKEKDLIREISMTEEYIYEEEQKLLPDTQKIIKWKNNLLKIKREYDEFILNLENKYPHYYELKYRNFIVGQKELTGNLKGNYNLIEYNLTDTTLVIFTINHQGIRNYTIAIDSSFYIALNGITKQLQNFDPTRHGNGKFEKFYLYAHTLYRILFQPVEKHLISNKVIIIPDEVLSYLPFDILLSQLPAKDIYDYRKLDYLINKYVFSYSYSATLLLGEPFINKRKTNNRVFALAPVYPQSPSENPFFRTRQRYLEHLYPLPGAKEEVALITGLFKGFMLTDSMANENVFKQYAPDFGILHLAMHTIIDNTNPMYSKLVFTQLSSGPDEGLLNTYELYNMQLNAKMVVLSACRSGDGLLQKGEGIMSLARGFLYAGCPSIVMTLWNVEDRTGAQIMYQFYKQIKKGKSKDKALQASKLEYLASAPPHKTHPYYWAGYLQIGDQSAIFVSARLKIFFIAVCLVLLLITAVYLKKSKNAPGQSLKKF